VAPISDNKTPAYLQSHAEIDWDDTGAPHSREFGDIYWNPNQGIAEKQHVFIEANNLTERWHETQSSFSILELGFGFGLNCLLAARLWQTIHEESEASPALPQTSAAADEPYAILNFISIEKYPVHVDALKRVYQTLNEKSLDPLAQRLIDQYPQATRGTHLIWLANNICLTLILDEGTEAIREISSQIDTIFLDGFSPGKNERMWNLELLSHLPEICHSETTLSTYSVSGNLRRGLTSLGFTIEKKQGFGRKLEMLTARLNNLHSRVRPRLKKTSKTHVTIIGSGIAGLACAKALLKRGFQVQMIDQLDKPVAGASSIAQLAVYPHISVRPDPFSLFSLSAFQYSIREQHCKISGYIRYPGNKDEAARFQRISDQFPSHFIASENSNNSACLIYKQGAWLRVMDAYATTLARLNIITGIEIAKIEKLANGWGLIDTQDNLVADTPNVILATGHSMLDILAPIDLNSNRGQAISIRYSSSSATDHSHDSIISNGKTLFPQDGQGHRVFSATNSRDSISVEPDHDDTQSLLAALGVMLDEPFELMSEQVGIRCTSRDRIPIVGRLPDWQALDHYCHQNRYKMTIENFGQYEKGLYVCTAFGAHGATHAPLCGEYLTKVICEEPVPKSWHELLSPERFKLRDRNKAG